MAPYREKLLGDTAELLTQAIFPCGNFTLEAREGPVKEDTSRVETSRECVNTATNREDITREGTVREDVTREGTVREDVSRVSPIEKKVINSQKNAFR